MTINLPITLTLIRLIISPIFLPFLLVWFLPYENVLIHYLLAGFFALLSITDFLDGYLARKYKQVTKIGTLLDPMADKFLVFSTLIALLTLGKIFFFWVIIFIGREFFVLGFRLAALERGFTIPVDWFGKFKTVAQTLYLFCAIAQNQEILFFEQLEMICLFLALVLTMISGFHYYRSFSRGWEVISSPKNENKTLEFTFLNNDYDAHQQPTL